MGSPQLHGTNLTQFLSPPRHSALELPSNEHIPSWFTIGFAAINGGGFCLNTLSLWILATRKFVYKCKINAFIVSLCVSDFLVSLSSFYYLGTITSPNISHFSKRVATIIFGFSLETSLMSLCNLSYERLTAIRQPFRYTEILSKTKVIGITAFGWTFCIALLAVQFMFGFIYRHHNYVYFNWIVFISLALISITFLAIVYVYLIYEIRRHASQIRSVSISQKQSNHHSTGSRVGSDVSRDTDQLTDVTYASSSSASTRMLDKHNADKYHEPPSYHDHQGGMVRSTTSDSIDLLRSALEKARSVKNNSERRRLSSRGQLLRKELRSVIFCLSIVVLFAATWMPVIVFFSRCLFSHSCEGDDQLLFVCSMLVSLNSLLDPILYFIIKREFRNFLCGKVCRSYSRRNSSDSRLNSRRGSSANYI